MSQENVEIVRRAYDAFNARDLERLLGLSAEDCEWLPLRAQLEGIGVTRDTLKPGDVIKARCHPLRDKSNGCLLGFLKTKDGTVKDWDGGKAPPPKDF